MAGIDYVKCNECGKRLFYDGDGKIRESMKCLGEVETLTCNKCVEKLKKKVEKLKKYGKGK